jgi:hypothetical protein
MEGAGLYMTIEEMRELFTKDEKITVEYKACHNKRPPMIYILP